MCIGPPNQRVAFTSTADIGRAAARLAVLALGPATAPNVPDHVRIAGSVVSYEDVRDLVGEIKGVEKGEIRSEDLEEHKQSLPGEREKPGSMMHYIRCVALQMAAQALRQEKANWKIVFVLLVCKGC